MIAADRVARIFRQVLHNKAEAFPCCGPTLIEKGMHIVRAIIYEPVTQLHLGGEDLVADQPIFQRNRLHPRQPPQGWVHPWGNCQMLMQYKRVHDERVRPSGVAMEYLSCRKSA